MLEIQKYLPVIQHSYGSHGPFVENLAMKVAIFHSKQREMTRDSEGGSLDRLRRLQQMLAQRLQRLELSKSSDLWCQSGVQIVIGPFLWLESGVNVCWNPDF